MKKNWTTIIALTILASSCKTGDPKSDVSEQATVTSEDGLRYPEPDKELGEFYHDGELDVAKQIPLVIENQLRTRYASGQRMMRDAHPKAHGCLKAVFKVNPDIDSNLAQGVFSKGNQFAAIIRYSNSSGDPTQPDIKGDGRGMAVKLLNVPGKKILEEASESKTQDFIMINHPVFFASEPKDYLNALKNADSSSILGKLSALNSLGIKGSRIALTIQSKKIASPIQSPYFSEVPYQLGLGDKRQAARYRADPCPENGADPVPDNTDDKDYLRHSLINHFKTADACYTISAQLRQDNSMSVEDSRDEWNSPWVPVATLTMDRKAQNIAESPVTDDARNTACDTLSFSPWHSLPEHKPLGAMNRLRKIIYEHISKFRHQTNKEVRKEPAS